jgi:uncharacterized membrane protein
MTDKLKTGLGNRIAPPRFILFVLVLIAVTAFAWQTLDPAPAFMTGFDAAAATFLIAMAPILRATGREVMQKHAAQNDANRIVLLGMATVVTLTILVAVAVELGDPTKANKPLVVATLALAWLFANTVYALHYAHIYYLEGSKGGLDFSGKPDNPDYADFVYFAYTLGMTFQTSDTAVETRQLRQIVTVHSLAAFIFNIGVIAFSINVLGSGGK